MNSVCLVGRLTADPEGRYTAGENSIAVASFTVAANRDFVNKNNPDAPTADFIRCQAFGKTAEFIQKYFHKGNRIGVTGRIQTGSYTNRDGQKVYTTDVVIDHVEFVENKSPDSGAATSTPAPSQSRTRAQQPQQDTSWMNVPAGSEDDLPFN